MSQEDVYAILKELGGEATSKEIRERAKKKYPQRTLYMYVPNRLRKLQINKKVEQIGEKWKIRKH